MGESGSPLLRGTVESYNEGGGFGYIRPDERTEAEALLLVHRRSLRDRNTVLREGDRVIFSTAEVPRGTLATDVHQEMEQSELHPKLSEGVVVKIAYTNTQHRTEQP